MSRRALLGVLVGLLVGALSLGLGSMSLPDLEMRSVPWVTHLGATRAEHAPGQRFTCARDGLRRIDVGVNLLGETPPSVLELVLRDAGPEGEVLRRVAGTRYERDEQRSWLGFEFEPLERSAGRLLHVTLLPSGGQESIWLGPWARPRGIAERHVGWGQEPLPGPVITGELLSRQRDLRGLAFAFREVDGPVSLTLRGVDDPQTLRSVQLEAHALNGWVLFPIDVVEGSRWRRYTYELGVPEGVEVLGVDARPSLVSVHGSGEVDPRLGGMTLGGEPREGLDLVLRAWSGSGPAVALGLLVERLGWRLAPILALWLAAGALLAAALPARRT